MPLLMVGYWGERIQQATALPLQVISPSIEGCLGYLGANAEATGLTNLVFDIGGGSTQVLVAEPAGQPLAVHSLPLGSVMAPHDSSGNYPPTIDERRCSRQRSDTPSQAFRPTTWREVLIGQRR